jgi:autotransporter-associated beta strand protein
MLPAWFRQLIGLKCKIAARNGHAAGHRLSARPQLESLEDRTVPAVHIWDGAISSSWINNANWLGGSPFGDPKPTVIFPMSPVQKTVIVDTPASQPIAFLEFDGSGYLLAGKPLVFTGDTQIQTTNASGTNTLALGIDQQPFMTFFDHRYNLIGNGILDVEGPVTGSPLLNSVDKIGTGTLKLAFPSNYGGETDIHAGTLLTQGSNILPIHTHLALDTGATFDLHFGSERIGSLAGAGTVLNGSLATGNDNTSTSFAGKFINIFSLFKEGTGTLLLTSSNGYVAGHVAITAGTIQQGAPDVLNSCSVQIQAGAALDLNSHGLTLASLDGKGSVSLGSASLGVFAGSFDGVIGGLGGVAKEGPATLSLNGVNTYTGLTQVQGGTLVVNGSLASVQTIVAPLGRLEGTGQVKSVFVAGTVRPGAAVPGTLSSDSVVFGPGSSFAVRLSGLAGHDELDATGPVNLSGNPTLKVTLGYVPSVGDKFTIVKSTSGIIGRFKGPSIVIVGGHTFAIIYTPTSVALLCIA